jgi:hypothetical protein
MHWAESFAGLFTRVLIGVAIVASAGYGARSGCSRSQSCMEGASHTSESCGDKITGILTCSGWMRAFATVVMIVQESMG